MLDRSEKIEKDVGVVTSIDTDTEEQSSPYYLSVCPGRVTNGIESSDQPESVDDNPPLRKRIKRDTVSSTSSVDDDMDRKTDRLGTNTIRAVHPNQSNLPPVTFSEEMPLVSQHSLTQLEGTWARNSTAGCSTMTTDVLTCEGTSPKELCS